MEVALRIHEPDADQRHAEVARLLAVIAGEHAEPAGVDRQRLVQRELGGEVGDRLARAAAEAAGTTTYVRPRAHASSAARARSYSRKKPVVALPPPRAFRAQSADSMRTGLCAVARHSV